MNNDCKIGKKSILLSSKDVQQIIADRFQVSVDSVFKSQYSYTVVLNDSDNNDDIRVDI